MRRINHRRHKKKQRKILIISISCLMFIMTVGYAAFSTNLNITAKGNILIKKIDINDLKNNVTVNGEGLYKDLYEENRYIYRGNQPDNYIEFNDELWRIIAIESDNTLKIIKENNIGKIVFDEIGNRTTGYCSKGRAPSDGCNVYGMFSGTFYNGQYSGIVSENSSLNVYLNNTFYNQLNDEKKYIINHDFKMGSIDYEQTTINGTITQENKYKWKGKIGLLNVTDFMRASLDTNCKDIISARTETYPCKNDNYLVQSMDDLMWWTMHAYYDVTNRPVYISNNGFISSTYAASYTDIYVRPVFFLSSDIILKGNGTETNPYVIINE